MAAALGLRTLGTASAKLDVARCSGISFSIISRYSRHAAYKPGVAVLFVGKAGRNDGAEEALLGVDTEGGAEAARPH